MASAKKKPAPPTVLTLRGRLGTALAGDAAFNLLLCTHIPSRGPGGTKVDYSARSLLAALPPIACYAHSAHSSGTAAAESATGHSPAGDSPAGDSPAMSVKRPYDLLISDEQAVHDWGENQLGLRGHKNDTGHPEAWPAVCNAHLSYPTRGYKGTPARRAYWQGEAMRLGGQWVEAAVEIHKYSFVASSGAATGTPGKVRRTGARLVLQGMQPMPGSI